VASAGQSAAAALIIQLKLPFQDGHQASRASPLERRRNPACSRSSPPEMKRFFSWRPISATGRGFCLTRPDPQSQSRGRQASSGTQTKNPLWPIPQARRPRQVRDWYPGSRLSRKSEVENVLFRHGHGIVQEIRRGCAGEEQNSGGNHQDCNRENQQFFSRLKIGINRASLFYPRLETSGVLSVLLNYNGSRKGCSVFTRDYASRDWILTPASGN